MLEAISCRLKFALWLLLFLTPVLLGLWGQSLDRDMVEDAFYPAPDPQVFLAQSDYAE